MVEFWGDDLRDAKIATHDNPFLAEMYLKDPSRSTGRGRKAQTLFGRYGFDCLIPGYELADYLSQVNFPGYYQTRPRLLLEDYMPQYPQGINPKPLLVHAPSHKGVKGTEAVLAAIAKLSAKHSFDFRLLHDLPRTEALATVANCDVFLDQFVLGCEGLAAHEAMALGKPVICFIKPSLLPRYPPNLPIIIADQHTLAQTFSALLENGPRRRELGVRSREYVEKYHDARKVAAELLEIYVDVKSSALEGQSRQVVRNKYWRTLSPEAQLKQGAH